MKKRMPIFLVIIFTAFPSMVKAEGFEELFGIFSFSDTIESSNQRELGVDSLFGIGLNVPLLFSREKEYGSYTINTTDLMIEPEITVEYGFLFSNILRIRTGAHFGKCDWGLLSLAYYAGLSGAFIKNFANNAFAFGISPEIGFEFYYFGGGVRIQAQYDFYTDARYNRFVFTLSASFWIFHCGRGIAYGKNQ